MRAGSSLVAVMVALFGAGAHAGVTEWRWPESNPSGPCHGLTLQQCIAAAPASGRVRVVRGLGTHGDYHAIPGTLTISRPLELVVDPGVDAVLAHNADIVFEAGVGQSGSVRIEGFVLPRGSIRVRPFGATPGLVRIARNRIGMRSAAETDVAIEVELATGASGLWQLELAENVLYSTGSDGPWAIKVLQNLGGTHQAEVRVCDNLIESRHPEGMREGIAIDIARTTRIDVERNIVRGGTDIDATSSPIRVFLMAASGAPTVRIADNWVHAAPTATAAGIAVRTGTQSPRIRVVNNTIVDGRDGVGANTDNPATEIDLYNNLVIGQRLVAFRVEGTSTVRNGANALFGNAGSASGFTLAGSTITAEPRLERRDFPVPRTGSPLRDAGDFSAWVVGASQHFDASGERRDRGGGIDVGALEGNDDRVFLHTTRAGNITGNYTLIETHGIGSHELLMVTPIIAAIDPAEMGQQLGIWNHFSSSSIFHEQPSVPMSAGRDFVVARFGPVPATSFLHDVTPANQYDFSCTRLPIPIADPAVAVATHRYEEAGGGTGYFAEPLAVRYRTGVGWLLCAESLAPMPVGRRFHLSVSTAPVKPNAFTTPALEEPNTRVALSHRLLDGQGCALPAVGRGHDPSRLDPAPNPRSFALRFDLPTGPDAPRRWSVLSVGLPGGPFPAESAFNVILSGTQALRCRVDADLLKDGFD